MSVYTAFLCWYLCGVILLQTAGLGYALLFSVCLGILSVVGVLLKRFNVRKIIYSAAVIIGVVVMSYAAEPAASLFDSYLDRYIEVEGIICEIPDEYDEHYSYIVSLEKLTYRGNVEEVDAKIRITSETEFSTGNRVAFRGFLDTISSPDNSTEFDYRIYYKGKGIEFEMHADEAQLIDERAFMLSPVYAAEYIKNRIGASIDKFYTDDDAGMIKAVLLGNRSEFSDEFEKTLVRTSALRLLYPSFLHTFLLLSICEFIFAAIPKRKREPLIVIALMIFAIFYGNYITFVRAALVLAVVMIYCRLRGFSHYPDIVSIVVTVCLVSNPLLIYNSGFVMSVSVGVLMHFFRYPLCAKLKFIKNINARNMISVWLIGTFGLMPFSAYFFNGIPVYSIIFTFVYTPLTLMLFILSPIVLLMFELFGTASFLGIFVDGLIDIMKKLPEMVALLPGHYITLAKTTSVGFAVVFLIAYILKCVADKRTKQTNFKLSVIGLTVIFAVYSISAFSEIGKMFVTFVNVGQGDAAIIDIRGRDTILIDGGGGTADSEYSIGEEVFLPYLTAKGYSKIDLAIVSHCHRDHIEGIVAAIENLKVSAVMMSDSGEGAEYREMIVSAAEKSGTEIVYVSAGDRIEFDSGFSIDVLSPEKNAEFADENDYSLALKMSYNGVDMFFGGDITVDAEKRIAGKIGEVDIAKVSHHGSASSSSREFIGEVKPLFAVCSVGANNMYSHPADRVVADYAKSGARILRTDTMGDIILECDGDKVVAGWYKEVLKWQ